MSSRDTLNVLDKGYVRLVKAHGTDLDVVNAARVSYAKESDWDVAVVQGEGAYTKLKDSDERLINFLAREGHMSPFRHVLATFEVYAPLMVARQWWKYVVGSDHTMDAWNEASRRYITMEPEFYIPDVWRSAPENSKQGSGEPLNKATGEAWTIALKNHIEDGLDAYNNALRHGIAPEQARLFLPMYAMYTAWRWTASLQSISHFLNERLEDDAQYEIREYAKAVQKLITPAFPVSMKALSRKAVR